MFSNSSLDVKYSWWAHPLLMLCVPWTIGCCFFFFEWTSLEMYEPSRVIYVVGIVLLPFLLTQLYLTTCGVMIEGKFKKREVLKLDIDVLHIWGRVKFLFVVWALLSLFEIFVSKGLPVIWLLTGSSLSYIDFGVHSLHGLLNSVLLICALFSSLLYYTTRERKFLIIPLIAIVWGVLTISRALILSNFLQILILYVLINGLSLRRLIGTFLVIAFFVISFGAIGDFRTSGFSDIVGSEGLYPDWLPSGFLWVYVYMMTPLNNLVNSFLYSTPMFDATFPNTMSLLFPSVIRELLFDHEVGKGLLVIDTFNISTGYIGPYIDYGWIGMVLLSILYGIVSFIAWGKGSVHGIIGYVIIAHCLLVSIFFNWLFTLPIAFQFVWIYFILYKLR